MDVKQRTATPVEKRIRSDESTTAMTGSQLPKMQKSDGGEPIKAKPSTSLQDVVGATFSQPVTAVKMTVVLDKYLEETFCGAVQENGCY